MITKLSTRLKTVLAVAAYIAALEASYVFVIAPRFAYYGMQFDPASLGILVVASILALAPATWLALDSDRPSSLTLGVVYLLLYIPSCLVPVCALGDDARHYLVYLFCIAACFWALSVVSRAPLLRFPSFRLGSFVYWPALAIGSVLVSVTLVTLFGIELRMPSLKGEIYELRHDYREILAGTVLAYAVVVQTKVVSPLFIVSGLRYRRPYSLAFGCASQLLVFLHGGVRTVLFSPVYLVGLHLLLRVRRERLLLALAIALTTVVGVSRLADLAFDEDRIYFSSTFVRRMLLTPGILSGYYFDFFSDNPKALYAHSVMEGFVDPRYTDSPPRVIAQTYYHSEHMSANAGFWADGYANFGLPGVALATALLGLVLWTFDSAARGADSTVATLLLAMPSMALVNSALLTVLVTHGLLFATLLIWAMPRAHFTAPALPGPHLGGRQTIGSGAAPSRVSLRSTP